MLVRLVFCYTQWCADKTTYGNGDVKKYEKGERKGTRIYGWGL